MSSHAEYSELVGQAEEAVAAVKDPELKRAAFERILEDLLGNRNQSPKAASGANKIPRAKPTNSSNSTKKKSGPQAHVDEMAEEGFFKKPKTIAEVKAELENRGHHIPLTSLSGPLQKLCQKRKLRRQKVKSTGKKETYSYSNW